MKIIKPTVELIQEPSNIKRIEIAGRTCYKSEDRIGPGTAELFCRMLIRRGHTAMLEHSNIILMFPYRSGTARLVDMAVDQYMLKTGKPCMLRSTWLGEERYIVSGNVRAWREVLQHANVEIFMRDGMLFDDMPNRNWNLDAWRVSERDLTTDERARHGIITARFVCAEGVSLEAFRHRIAAADYEQGVEPPAVCLSPAQESTRYVDYGGADIQFVEPWWWDDPDAREKWGAAFEVSCLEAEKHYNHLRRDDLGAPPQAARAVLTKSVKTEIVITQTPERWRDWLVLREAQSAHPDMQICARLFREAVDGLL